jgi:epoxyqueuosine reductase
MATLQEKLQKDLEQAGYPARIVSITHLEDLRKEIESLLDSGVVQKSLYQEELKYWKFDYSSECPDAQSLVIVAMPQPIVKMRLSWQRKQHEIITPPTYDFKKHHLVTDLIEKVLEPEGYQLKRASVPQKLLAVHSGLSEYGRNNVSYIPGYGSYCRLMSFISDLPCTHDNWQPQPLKMMQACNNCQACIKNCPTKAINPERFIINIDRCLTYWNEYPDPIPEWIDKESHNALVGCMRCQEVCPQNAKHAQTVIIDHPYSEEELSLILSNIEMDKLPPKLVDTLKELGHDYSYREKTFARNLQLLLDKDEK